MLTAITGVAAATVGFAVALDAGADVDSETEDAVCNDDVDVADTAGLDAEPPPPHHRHSVRRDYPTPIMPWCFVLTSLRLF